MNKRNEGHSNA